jgi:hypothetical protein
MNDDNIKYVYSAPMTGVEFEHCMADFNLMREIEKELVKMSNARTKDPVAMIKLEGAREGLMKKLDELRRKLSPVIDVFA